MTVEWMDGWIWMDGWMDGWMEDQMDKVFFLFFFFFFIFLGLHSRHMEVPRLGVQSEL